MVLDAVFCKQKQHRRLQRSGKLEQISGHGREKQTCKWLKGICANDLLTRSKYVNLKFNSKNRFFKATDWKGKLTIEEIEAVTK